MSHSSCNDKAVEGFCLNRKIERMVLQSYKADRIFADGQDFIGSRIKELYLDNATLYVSPGYYRKLTIEGAMARLEDDDRRTTYPDPVNRFFALRSPDFTLFEKIKDSLERLGIQNVRISTYGENRRLPLSQKALVRGIRAMSQLVWLRSDLTMENVAMLKQERPGITFESSPV